MYCPPKNTLQEMLPIQRNHSRRIKAIDVYSRIGIACNINKHLSICMEPDVIILKREDNISLQQVAYHYVQRHVRQAVMTKEISFMLSTFSAHKTRAETATHMQIKRQYQKSMKCKRISFFEEQFCLKIANGIEPIGELSESIEIYNCTCDSSPSFPIMAPAPSILFFFQFPFAAGGIQPWR